MQTKLILNEQKSRIWALKEKTQVCRLGYFESPYKTNAVECLHFMRVLQFLQQHFVGASYV